MEKFNIFNRCKDCEEESFSGEDIEETLVEKQFKIPEIVSVDEVETETERRSSKLSSIGLAIEGIKTQEFSNIKTIKAARQEDTTINSTPLPLQHLSDSSTETTENNITQTDNSISTKFTSAISKSLSIHDFINQKNSKELSSESSEDYITL